MRRPLLAFGFLLTALCATGAEPLFAQTQNPPVDVPNAPQPQKKPAAKTSPSQNSASQSDSSSGQQGRGSSSPAAEQNPFPEDVSRRAAGSAREGETSAKTSSAAPAGHSTAEQNPFPEDVSRRAAGQTGSSPEAGKNGSKSAQPAGSSPDRAPAASDSGKITPPASQPQDDSLKILDPDRAKKDTGVGHFYMQRGDPQGAYLRYQDAVRYDPANVDAIFGLAEAAEALKKYPEAERNYQLYLAITTHGPKVKQAEKALRALAHQEDRAKP